MSWWWALLIPPMPLNANSLGRKNALIWVKFIKLQLFIYSGGLRDIANNSLIRWNGSCPMGLSPSCLLLQTFTWNRISDGGTWPSIFLKAPQVTSEHNKSSNHCSGPSNHKLGDSNGTHTWVSLKSHATGSKVQSARRAISYKIYITKDIVSEEAFWKETQYYLVSMQFC